MLKKSRSVVVIGLVLAAVLGAEAAFAGSPIGSNFEVMDDPSLEEMAPAVAYNPERQEYLVVWYNDRPGNDDIRAWRFNKQGQPLGGPFYVAAGPGASRRNPAVTYALGENQYLVVWQNDDPSYGFGIRGQRLNGTGGKMGGEIMIRHGAASLYTPGVPKVEYALAAGKYLVVWHEAWVPSHTTDVKGQAIKLDGQLDGGDFVIDADPGSSRRRKPDLAYNRARNEFLVVWEQDAAGSDEDIYGKRVKMAGGAGPLGSPIEIVKDAKEQWDPAVAALPQPAGMGQYMVVWRHRYSAVDSDIMGATIRGDGTNEGVFIVAWEPENEISPAIASSEASGNYLVTWTHEHTALNIMETIQAQEV
ncbi:MAG: hypothetical protein ACK2U9_00230, partial [Anaerolineae bacterium]